MVSLDQRLVFKAFTACHDTYCGIFNTVVEHLGGLQGVDDWVAFESLKRLYLSLQALKLQNLSVVLVLKPFAFSF